MLTISDRYHLNRFTIVLMFCVILIVPFRNTGFCTEDGIGYILADDNGNVIKRQNDNQAFIPASIIKLLTSLAAVHTFKETYRFPTQYIVDATSSDLYVKGFGDPLFISEVIDTFCRNIAFNFKTVRHIICDTSYFSPDIQIPGTGCSLNPYDSTVGALSANFNTINFKWDKRINQFVSAEPQTPLLDQFQDKIRNTGFMKGRIVLSRKETSIYPGLLIQYFLKKNKSTGTGNILQGKLLKTEQEIQIFHSPYSLMDVIQKLLEFSNNFMANQLLLALGAENYGPPATLEKGVMALKNYAAQILLIENFNIAEGSGLSRSNTITPAQMMTVLNHFSAYYHLLNKRGNDHYKTGTLTGIRTRAGYLLGKDNRLYPYVIMVNRKNKSYNAILEQFILSVSQISE